MILDMDRNVCDLRQVKLYLIEKGLIEQKLTRITRKQLSVGQASNKSSYSHLIKSIVLVTKAGSSRRLHKAKANAWTSTELLLEELAVCEGVESVGGEIETSVMAMVFEAASVIP
jgi:hypothetical protein